AAPLCDEECISGAGVFRGADGIRSEESKAALSQTGARTAVGHGGWTNWRGQYCGVVPGAYGVGAARARQPVDRGSSRAAQYEGRLKCPHQAQGVVSPICTFNSGGTAKRIFRA